MSRTLRILIGKPGLDGHDRGAKVIARALRDAGIEVIYTGLHQTPEMIVQAAIQESVDAIGLSIMSGAHNTLMPAVVDLLKEKGAEEVAVFGGGIIPEDDIPFLKSRGVKEIFTPGTPISEVLRFLKDHLGWEGDPDVVTKDTSRLVSEQEKEHHRPRGD